MKKAWVWIRRVLLSIVMALACLILCRDCAIARVVEMAGSSVTGTKVSIGGFFTSPTGIVMIEDLVVGNPDGYDSSDCALRLGVIKVNLNPLTVCDPCVRIHEIKMRGLRFNFEVANDRSTNHGALLDNIKKATEAKEAQQNEIRAKAQPDQQAPEGQGVAQEEPVKGEAQRYEIKHLEICDNYVVLYTPLKGASLPVPMLPVIIDNIGLGNGIYMQECIEEVSDELVKNASTAASGIGDVGKEVLNAVGETGNKAIEDLKNSEALKNIQESGGEALKSVQESGSKAVDDIGSGFKGLFNRSK
ncbi:MAG: hypothetical protein MJ025_03355 [Victivallaceae bacterium]|nr:hypothetical protein [Victivallaceae bacterium]